MSHLDAGPTIRIVTGRNHGASPNRPIILRKIGNRRQAQTDVDNISPSSQQTQREGILCILGILTEVVSYDYIFATTIFFKLKKLTQPKPQLQESSIIDLHIAVARGFNNPSRIVLAETGIFDANLGEVFSGIIETRSHSFYLLVREAFAGPFAREAVPPVQMRAERGPVNLPHQLTISSSGNPVWVSPPGRLVCWKFPAQLRRDMDDARSR